MTHRAAFARGRARNKHLALLSGLLYCDSCATRMVYSYAGKKDCKYPYYVCLNAQRKGWAVCPVKSLSARRIEESVLERIREEQAGILEPAEWGQMNRVRQVEALTSRRGAGGLRRDHPSSLHPVSSVRDRGGGRTGAGVSGPQEVSYTLDLLPDCLRGRLRES
jgi:hypothetical protein